MPNTFSICSQNTFRFFDTLIPPPRNWLQRFQRWTHCTYTMCQVMLDARLKHWKYFKMEWEKGGSSDGRCPPIATAALIIRSIHRNHRDLCRSAFLSKSVTQPPVEIWSVRKSFQKEETWRGDVSCCHSISLKFPLKVCSTHTHPSGNNNPQPP